MLTPLSFDLCVHFRVFSLASVWPVCVFWLSNSFLFLDKTNSTHWIVVIASRVFFFGKFSRKISVRWSKMKYDKLLLGSCLDYCIGEIQFLSVIKEPKRLIIRGTRLVMRCSTTEFTIMSKSKSDWRNLCQPTDCSDCTRVFLYLCDVRKKPLFLGNCCAPFIVKNVLGSLFVQCRKVSPKLVG